MKTFRDVYELPFSLACEGDNFVYDNKGNFVFQFETDNKDVMYGLLNLINRDEHIPLNLSDFSYKDGNIYFNGRHAIIIRGWGHLTGILRLSNKEAAHVQDTLGEYIINKLNGKH